MARAKPVLVDLSAAANRVALSAVGLLINFIEKDYQAAVARDAGEVPCTFFEYVELNLFRVNQVRMPRVAPEVSPQLFTQRGFLERLPHKG